MKASMWKWTKTIVALGTYLAAWYTFLDVTGILGTYVSPFKPVAELGHPSFRLLDGTAYLAIVAPISINNRGWQPGCIVDIALRIKAQATKTEWSFFPTHYLKPHVEDETQQKKGKAWKLAIESSPTPIPLGGRQTLTKTALFLHRPPNKHPRLTISDLKPNEFYEMTLHLLTSVNGCIVSDRPYTPSGLASVKFGEHLAGIKEGLLVQIPPHKLDILRETFIAQKQTPN